MRKAVLLFIAVTAGLMLLASVSGGLSVAEEPTPVPTEEPTPTPWPYVLYVPLVIKGGSGNETVSPADYCWVSYLEGAATGNGLKKYCQSAGDPWYLKNSIFLATARAPSPGGGYGHFLGRSYYFFSDTVSGSPVLNLRIQNAWWYYAPRAVLEVYTFPVSWTMPFSFTEQMLALRGEKLGETVVLSQTAPFTVTISLSGLRPGQAVVVLSPCETQHEICAEAGHSYEYQWWMSSLEVTDVWLSSESYPWP